MHAQRVAALLADQEPQNSSRNSGRQAQKAALMATRDALAARFAHQCKNQHGCLRRVNSLIDSFTPLLGMGHGLILLGK
jgi:hypothetical protein